LVGVHPHSCARPAGVHPHHAGGFRSDQAISSAPSGESAVVAVGECGLDFFRHYSSVEDQQRVFRLQLEWPSIPQTGILHQRNAHDPLSPF